MALGSSDPLTAGYVGYGDWIREARQIVITQEKLKDFAIDTHIRLESDVMGAVSLNSTYNEDYYNATPNTKTYLNAEDSFSTASGSSAVSLFSNKFDPISMSTRLIRAATIVLVSSVLPLKVPI